MGVWTCEGEISRYDVVPCVFGGERDAIHIEKDIIVIENTRNGRKDDRSVGYGRRAVINFAVGGKRADERKGDGVDGDGNCRIGYRVDDRVLRSEDETDEIVASWEGYASVMRIDGERAADYGVGIDENVGIGDCPDG